jgi:dipeptidyl aminopeptidase/acylaminoacyl peptidase
MFTGPKYRFASRRALAALVALPAILVVTGVCSASSSTDPLTGPAFAYVSQEAVDGIAQVSVTYPSNGVTIRGVVYLPAGNGSHPGVLLNHDGSHGVDAALMRRARDLAKLGYVVMTPAYRSDSGSLGKATENAQEVGDVLAAAQGLAQHPRVADKQLAIMGTSHGAFVSMLAVMQNPKQFRCVAQASGAADVPREASKVKLPILLQHGWKDEVVEIGDAMYLAAEMRRSGNATARVREYSLLGHNLWFSNDPAFGNDQVSQANWAWEDLTTFLDTYMQRGQASTRTPDERQAVKAGMGVTPSGQ